MSESRLSMMVNATKKPCVLRLKLIREKDPERPLFVFEGNDDYDFYFHALHFSEFSREFTHVNGEGKDQSISLFEELVSEHNECLNETYFFVDQDYSLFCYSNRHIFTLPFYAIENPLCDNKVIKHFLTSTFKFDEGNKSLMEQIMKLYTKAKADFFNGIRTISIQLYMSRVLSLGVEFPNNEELFDSIKKDSVTFRISELPEITERLSKMTEDERSLYNSISELSPEQLIRGKYVYHFIKEWLMVIKKYIHARIDSAKAIDKSNSLPISKLVKEQYEHKDLAISRLAPSCGKIKELTAFINSI
ncbi:TPA: DUF4435 domain-containing protein [Klebsiella oxytoca]|nr:DUF4435 domain-containing protein [Klebsiella oxytoca]